ncbi:hypothetical protein FHT12_000852 [Xanthomonas campestris]|nr:hypothetical protein [Xanthomonas euroxanthea]NIJ92194.1 hypothetical protein [Xanthomonas euroxanthea]
MLAAEDIQLQVAVLAHGAWISIDGRRAMVAAQTVAVVKAALGML